MPPSGSSTARPTHEHVGEEASEMREQTVIWTALPNGRSPSGALRLSVLVTPRLVTDEGGDSPSLSLFPDFLDWPSRVGAASFTLALGTLRLAATNVTGSHPQALTRWQTLFRVSGAPGSLSADGTKVHPWARDTRATRPFRSYPAADVASTISDLYGTTGRLSPTSPPVLTSQRGSLVVPQGSPVANLTAADSSSALSSQRAYFTRGALDPAYKPVAETIDFHGAVAHLGSYPTILRELGLVIDLEVPAPTTLPPSATVQVIATWTSTFGAPSTIGGPTNVTRSIAPATACSFAGGGFTAEAHGRDHDQGMLNLSGGAFDLIDLDIETAGRRVHGATSTLNNVTDFAANAGGYSDQESVALPLPALRTGGLRVTWSGRASVLKDRASSQSAQQDALEAYVADQTKPVPTFHLEDLIRGYRIDVQATGPVATPWRSLHKRDGSYRFGAADVLTASDEGFVRSSAAGEAGTLGPAAPDLFVSETLALWDGWSLSAPRVGGRVGIDSTAEATPSNDPSSTPDNQGKVSPAFSANFSVTPGTLPKLRIGTSYRFRARSVDLAGNGPGLDAVVDAASSAPTTFRRYEPIARPAVVPTEAPGPGQSTFTVALVNDQLHNVKPVGRWLFPPKVAELTAEQHGSLDGFAPGKNANPALPPAGDAATYAMVAGSANNVGRADATINQLPGLQSTAPGSDQVYLPATGAGANPLTPWLPDPLAAGLALVGLPGDAGSTITMRSWPGARWPDQRPILLRLVSGASASHSFTAASASLPATETIVVPPGATYNVRLSSTPTDESKLGVFSWVVASLNASGQSSQVPTFTTWARKGRLWQLTPPLTIQLIHAVRLPLKVPTFSALSASTPRTAASTALDLADPMFQLDIPSTTTIDVLASWSDPIDEPTSATRPDVATTNHSGLAFTCKVPTPAPLGAIDQPLQLVPAPAPAFSLKGTHQIGDTKHHLIRYQARATSRFAEFFTTRGVINRASASTLSFSNLGLKPGLVVEPASVHIFQADGTEVPRSYYQVSADQNTLEFTVFGRLNLKGQRGLTVEFTPTVTLDGTTKALHVLSTARPAAPKIDRITPAWSIDRTSTKSMATYKRHGNTLRVYLDRPWWSTGSGELLGVVALRPNMATTTPPLLTDPHQLTTQMGLDPISLAWDGLYEVTTPPTFTGTATVPSVPGRSQSYSSPPLVRLVEDSSDTLYRVHPYAVSYDAEGDQWYADVTMDFGVGNSPPPGYFVRLALVRFQPYSIEGARAEVSNVVVATFAQPVVDRSVTMVRLSPTTLRVTVAGPAYRGFRPLPSDGSPLTDSVGDAENPGAAHPYSQPKRAPTGPVTSMMVAEVQVYDTASGLIGDLAWVHYASVKSTYLSPTFTGSDAVWTGSITLPDGLGPSTKLRLRVSELDYTAGDVAPKKVDTTFRRPFVAHLPIS